MDEQKKSGLDLSYLIGIYAIVKLVREYKMGDHIGRPLSCVKDANKQEENCVCGRPTAAALERWATIVVLANSTVHASMERMLEVRGIEE